MITRRVWLPGVGTYSVERYGAAADPSKGRVIFEEELDGDSDETGRKVAGNPGSSSALTHSSITAEDQDNAPVEREVPSEIPDAAHVFLRSIALCNTATLQYDKEDAQFETDGDPTEVALQVFAHRFASAKKHLLDAGWKQVEEFPFDSDIKRMSVVFEEPETKQIHVFAKGAVERVLSVCATYGQGEAAHPMTEDDKAHIQGRMNTLASEGLVSLSSAHFRPRLLTWRAASARHCTSQGPGRRGRLGQPRPR